VGVGGLGAVGGAAGSRDQKVARGGSGGQGQIRRRGKGEEWGLAFLGGSGAL